MKSKFNIVYSLATSAGVKKQNQDLAWVGSNKIGQCLAIICDGIGSEKNSDLASKIVLETFTKSFMKKGHIFLIKRWFEKNLQVALNKLIRIYQTEKKQIGTTIVLCLISNDIIHSFNIGDSRLYHFSFEHFKWSQKTKDHTLYNFLVERHAPEISFIKHKNNLLSLTQFIDSTDLKREHIGYCHCKFVINENDVLFLASDGLYNFIDLGTLIEQISINGHKEFSSICDILIKKAMDNYSNDNLSGIVIQFDKNMG